MLEKETLALHREKRSILLPIIRRKTMMISLVLLVLAEVACGLSAQSGRQRLNTNVEGPLFVDESCIDCDTCRWMAPDTFDRAKGQSFVFRQPGDEEAWVEAESAALACPTGSIRSLESRPKEERKRVRDRFPVEVVPDVYHAGYHSKKSFGATSYVAKLGDIVVMVDSPRYSGTLAANIEKRFGLAPKYMLLTHIDDVSDHNKWKERFPDMERVMHKADIRGPDEWPYIETRNIEIILGDDDKDEDEWSLSNGRITALHVPGHSQGSLAFLMPDIKAIFTGDHLAYSSRLDRLDGMARYGWNIPLQADSIAKLKHKDFLHILPGHGRRMSFQSQEDRENNIQQAADTFRKDPHGREIMGKKEKDLALSSS